MAFQCTKSAKLITFNFKFLHRRISTHNFLKKIGLVDSEKCTFCERETEKLVHLFSACPKTQFFWTNFKVWLQSCQVIRDLKHQDGRDGRRLPGSEITPMSRTTHDTKAASSRPALVSDVKTDVLPSYVQRE